MRKIFVRLATIMLTLVMVLNMFPVSGFADTEGSKQNLQFGSGSGRKNLSPASAMFVARLVFAGIAFFLILLLFLTRR